MIFTVNMSEPVVVNTTGGTPAVALTIGDKASTATYSGGSGTSALTFSYTPQPGDYDMDGVALTSPVILNGGTIKDNAGNDAVLTFTPPTTSGVKVDYPSLLMDFATNSYRVNSTSYNSLSSFLTATGGTFSRNSPGTYFDSSGILQTASANMPRFDHDPDTHAATGILIEGSRTNFVPASTALNTWSQYTGTPHATASVVTAPDGTTTAWTLSNTDASVTSYFYLPIAPTAASGTSFTFSIWAKRDAGSVNIGYGGSSDITVSPIVNVNGSAWKRYSVTTTTSVTNGRVWPQITVRAGASITVWGAQLEQGGGPSSYIPTSGSAVTRNGDIFTIPTGSWYDQTAGTVSSDVTYVSSAGTGYPMLWRFDDGSDNNRWDMMYDQNNNQVAFDGYHGGVAQGWRVFNTTTAASVRVGAAMAANNARAAMNGSLSTPITSWTPPTVNKLTESTSSASKWIKSFRYYPARLPDTALQSLTQ